MTAAILNFPRHWLIPCGPSGIQRMCVRCNTIHANIPTDCPGHKIDYDTQDMIYRGELDYNWRAGGWVHKKSALKCEPTE